MFINFVGKNNIRYTKTILMKKFIFTLLLLSIFYIKSFSQCTTSLITYTPSSANSWTVSYFDTEEASGEGANNGKAIYSIDKDTMTYWHTKWQNVTSVYPHEIQLNLGANYDVNGVYILSRHNGNFAKPRDYELYLSTDGVTWGAKQSAGTLQYTDLTGISQRAYVFFGAINAKYIKLVFLSNNENNAHIAISEIGVFQSTGSGCGATGQNNQVITFPEISKKQTQSLPITLNATTNTSLSIVYSIVSGPATVSGNTLTLTGVAGNVVVKASQAGNASYYPTSKISSFTVIDLSTYYPVVNQKITHAYKVEMPDLKPYMLYADASIDEPDFLSITSIEFSVNGSSVSTIYKNGTAKALWTPTYYGTYTISATAKANNGKTTTNTTQVEVVNNNATKIVATFDGNVIDWGTIGSQWFTGTYTLPQSVGAYNKIIAKFTTSCPSVAGGCDDWDRLAWVEIKAPNGDWMELFRYITPYAKGCAHAIDVTDFESILQGNTEIRMYIETWGSGGWKLDLDFEYQTGTPDFLYSTVEEKWHGTYNFGNPIKPQPMDTVVIDFPNSTEKSKFRLTTTGHGWGNNNTGNAAEFYHATHNLKINDADAFQQDLWTVCNPNPDGCTGQAGTWQYNRAGWCPGTIAMPFSYDLTPHLEEAPFKFSYIFQESYTDLCNSANPNCVTGTTCPDCNDGYNPMYRIGGYQINFSNDPVLSGIKNTTIKKDFSDLTISIYPNPTTDKFKLEIDKDFGEMFVNIIDIKGATIKNYLFKSKSEVNNYMFNVNSLEKGVYFVKVYNKDNFSVKSIVIQ